MRGPFWAPRYVVQVSLQHCQHLISFSANINMISDVFKRPVTGIHNRTYGLIFDLVECIIQRDFSYITDDIRVAYNHLKETLLDPSVRRVVLVGTTTAV